MTGLQVQKGTSKLKEAKWKIKLETRDTPENTPWLTGKLTLSNCGPSLPWTGREIPILDHRGIVLGVTGPGFESWLYHLLTTLVILGVNLGFHILEWSPPTSYLTGYLGGASTNEHWKELYKVCAKYKVF